jgi:hypothetical protein
MPKQQPRMRARQSSQQAKCPGSPAKTPPFRSLHWIASLIGGFVVSHTGARNDVLLFCLLLSFGETSQPKRPGGRFSGDDETILSLPSDVLTLD